MSESFLSRWSRQKSESRQPLSEPAAERGPDAPQADAAALTPEEIAALPRIDTLTAESDITVFLRKGVPAPLRNAALRAAWLADPAIRDFVGPARDYSYDWNTPGGAPGHGALEPGDDVVAMLKRVFGESADEPKTAERKSDEPAADGAPGAES